MFTTRCVAVVEANRCAAEMLHTFFRLMELECSLIRPDADAVPTVRRLCPDVLIVDFDLPNLRALEIAHEIRGPAPDRFRGSGRAVAGQSLGCETPSNRMAPPFRAPRPRAGGILVRVVSTHRM